VGYSDYIYFEYNKGDLLVVEDLEATDYAYADEYSRYEVREKGIRLGNFDSLEEVTEFLDGAGMDDLR